MKQLSREVFMALGPDKWLTCGMYLVTGGIVSSRLFASDYLDATTQALWAANAPACGWGSVRFVECPVPCRDATNTSIQETLILSSVALFLQRMVMLGKAPHRLSAADIAQLNRHVMPRLCDIPELGDTDGPVVIHRIRPRKAEPRRKRAAGGRR